MIRAGRLRHSVVIKQLTQGRGPAGEALTTTTDVVTIRAHVGVISGRENWANEQTKNSYEAAITTRYTDLIKEDMQAHYDGKVMDIKAIIDPSGYKKELKLLVTRHA